MGMMIGGAIVNALAFTAVNNLFSLLGRSDEAEKERKRHDLAIETLQRAESEYQHKRRLRLDYLNQQLRAEQHSLPDVGAEPTLNDYYEPSALQKEYELMFIAGGLALAGWAAFKFL